MDNNNSPPPDPAEENNNNHNINNSVARNLEDFAACYRPEISFRCRTRNPSTTSISISIRIPRVPFVITRSLLPRFPTTSVAFGVVPLGFCRGYEDFMSLLRMGSMFYHQGIFEDGPPTRDNPVPGYDLSYEMLGHPVGVRVRFYTHSWTFFKEVAGLVVLEKRREVVRLRDMNI